MYIVVEVTLNRAEYGSQRSDQPENVNFEPINLKVTFLTETKCKIRLIYVRLKCKRKKNEGGRCLTLNGKFHFKFPFYFSDYLPNL